MQSFPKEETTLFLTGPVGQIEVIATPSANDVAATAIICHPHPLFGGTMNNKVVTTLARAFQDMGLRTVRFNFRGVGKTAGTFDNGNGETDDTRVIVEWVKQQFPQDAIWMAGFSFGSFVAAKTASIIHAAQLISIAPPVMRFPFADLPPMTCPWLIVQGETDDVVVPDEVYHFVENTRPKPTLIRMPGVGHFFHGKLLELRENIVQTLKPYLN